MKSAQRQFSRLVSPAALKVLRLTSRVTGQKRARVMVRNPQDELLLVWETIGSNRWSLPGGGIKRGEDPAVAATRELHEELGIKIEPHKLRQVAFLQNKLTNVGYDAHIFSVSIDKTQLPAKLHNPIEIIDAKWFKVDALPKKISPLVDLSLKHLSK